MAQSIFENMRGSLSKPRARKPRADDVNPGTAPKRTVWRKMVVSLIFLWLMVYFHIFI